MTPERYVAEFIAHGEVSPVPLPEWERPYQEAGVIAEAEQLGYIWIGSDVACAITVTPLGRRVVENERLRNLLCLADDVIMDALGAFPLDDGPRRVACLAIRKETGDDYHERKSRAARALRPA